MGVFSNANIVQDASLYFRNKLISGVSDPQSGTRQAESKFVVTVGAQRPIQYPFMQVEVTPFDSQSIGERSEGVTYSFELAVSLYSKSAKQIDMLAGSVINYMRTSQLETFIPDGLYDYRHINTVNLDEPGKHGLHRRELSFQFKYDVI